MVSSWWLFWKNDYPWWLFLSFTCLEMIWKCSTSSYQAVLIQRSGTVFACENWCIKGIMHLRLFLAAAGWFASCIQQWTCIASKLSSTTGTPMYFLFAILFCRSSSWALVFFILPQKPKQRFSASSLSLFLMSTSVFPFGISVFQQFPWLAKQACWNSCSSCTAHSFQNSWQVLFKSMSALHSTPHFSGLFCIAVSRPSLVSWSLLPWFCNHLPKHSSRSCSGAGSLLIKPAFMFIFTTSSSLLNCSWARRILPLFGLSSIYITKYLIQGQSQE